MSCVTSRRRQQQQQASACGGGVCQQDAEMTTCGAVCVRCATTSLVALLVTSTGLAVVSIAATCVDTVGTVPVLWAGHFQCYIILICQIKYTEAVLSNSTRKLLWFEISKMLIAFKKINLLCQLLQFSAHSFPTYARAADAH